jgi:uncharacterized membrane protein
MAEEPVPADPTLVRAEQAEQRLRPTIHHALRIGSTIGALLLVVGLAALALAGGSTSGTAQSRLDGAALRAAFLAPSPNGILLLGAVVLAVTPLSRVALAAGIFASARDRPLLAIALFVMLVLAATVVAGVFS